MSQIQLLILPLTIYQLNNAFAFGIIVIVLTELSLIIMKKLFRKFLKFILKEGLDILDEIVDELQKKAREKALKEIEELSPDNK